MKYKIFYRTTMTGGNGCQACVSGIKADDSSLSGGPTRISEDFDMYNKIFDVVKFSCDNPIFDCPTEEVKNRLLSLSDEEIVDDLFVVKFDFPESIKDNENTHKGLKLFAFSYLCKLGFWKFATDEERPKIKYKCSVYAREAMKYITHSHVCYFAALGIEQSYVYNGVPLDKLTEMITYLLKARDLVLEGANESDKKPFMFAFDTPWKPTAEGSRSFRYNIIAVLATTYLKLGDRKKFQQYNEEAKQYMHLNGSYEMGWVYKNDAIYKNVQGQDYQEDLEKYLLLQGLSTSSFDEAISYLQQLDKLNVTDETKQKVRDLLEESPPNSP